MDWELDSDGYPTEETLKTIREWDYRDGYASLLRNVESVWCYEDYCREDEFRKWDLSTGGWSGNEDIIGALEENTMFWLTCWWSSRRGGHYVFKIPPERSEGPK